MDGLFLTSRRHWWKRVNNTLIESHLSMTSRLSRERTRTARLTDRDANDCAIPPSPCPNQYSKRTYLLSQLYKTEKVRTSFSWRMASSGLNASSAETQYKHIVYKLSLACNAAPMSITTQNNWLIDWVIDWLINFIILTSLFNACRSYRDRKKPANGTQCPTLTTDS